MSTPDWNLILDVLAAGAAYDHIEGIWISPVFRYRRTRVQRLYRRMRDEHRAACRICLFIDGTWQL